VNKTRPNHKNKSEK